MTRETIPGRYRKGFKVHVFFQGSDIPLCGTRGRGWTVKRDRSLLINCKKCIAKIAGA